MAIPLLCVSWIGCGSDGGEAALSSPTEQSFGLMSVTYSRDLQGTDESKLELVTTAQFVRYSAVDHKQVSRLLALPLSPDVDLPQADRCRVYDLSVDLDRSVPENGEMASVELLEAGDLAVNTSAGRMTLVPRHYPGLLPFIFGVVYGEAQSDRVDQAGSVEVSSRGGEMVGSFTVRARTPSLPRLSTIAGEVDVQQGLAVRWDARSSSGDVFYLELRKSDGKREQVLRCQPRDDGEYTITAAALQTLGLQSGERAQLELARLRRTSFEARGLERAELQLTIRDRAALTIR